MHVEKADAIFARGFNCAQAVIGAFAEEYGMDFETAMRAASSLGGGVGHSGEVCGAALGMCMAYGLANGYGTDPDTATKDAHNAHIKGMMEAFRSEFGNTACDTLRIVGDRERCAGFVRYAAKLVEKEISI